MMELCVLLSCEGCLKKEGCEQFELEEERKKMVDLRKKKDWLIAQKMKKDPLYLMKKMSGNSDL